jgi:hypothetical protein
MDERVRLLWDHIKPLWPYARTMSGTFAAVLTFACVMGKAMFEFIGYFQRKWDAKVQDFLDSNVLKGGYTLPGGGRTQQGISKSISEIAVATGLSQDRVLVCLRRLKLKRLVAQDQPGYWKADVPHVTAT